MKKLTKTSVLTVIMILLANAAFCIISNYTFASGSGVYEPITNSISYGTPNNDEESFDTIPLGFYFTFNDQTYQTISINANGFIVMGPVAVSSHNAISTGSSNNLIAAMNQDLISRNDSGLIGTLKAGTSGSAPNRIFTVQWTNYLRNLGFAAENLNFQIKLFETSNQIQFVYGTCYAENGSDVDRIQVGLRGNSNIDFRTRMTAASWNATTCGSANSATCLLSETVFPQNGLVFTWSPPDQNIPPNIAEVIDPTNQEMNVSIHTSLNWQGTGGSPASGYKIFFGTDDPPTNILNGIYTCATSYQHNQALDNNTTYYWKVIPVNAAGEAAGCPTWSFTTTSGVSPVSLPYLENLDNLTIGQIPESWIVFDSNNDNKTWRIVNSTGQTGSVSLACEGNPGMSMDDWLISPPVLLQAQRGYRYRMYVRTNSTTALDRLSMSYGIHQNPASMVENASSPTWMIGENYFVMKDYMIYPETTDIYYFGIHGFSDPSSASIFIDDIKIHAYNGGCYPPSNISAIVENGGIHLSWTPPSEITVVGYQVYRDGELLNPSLYSDTSFMDYDIVLGQQYTYMIKVLFTDPEGFYYSDPIQVITTGIDDQQITVPINTGITGNYPNPFPQNTNIKYQVSEASYVRIDIYNVLGQRVRSLVDETKKANLHSVSWDGKDNHGVNVPSGIYFCKMTASGKNSTRKLIMLK